MIHYERDLAKKVAN